LEPRDRYAARVAQSDGQGAKLVGGGEFKDLHDCRAPRRGVDEAFDGGTSLDNGPQGQASRRIHSAKVALRPCRVLLVHFPCVLG